MRKLVLFLFLVMMLLSSCKHRTLYNSFYSMPMNGWHQDSVLCYAVDMSAAGCCDVLLTVRHTMDYPYQNLWLFVDEYVDSVLIQQDTVEAMLADDYGRWLGNGYYRYELSLLYDEDYCFSESSQYTFSIRQGMRSDWLQGITDVGLKVIRK